MSRYLDRLRRGERCWSAEIALRAIGVLLLGGSYRLGLLLHRMVVAPPPHQATPAEFGICAATVLLLASGLACTTEGPGLFRQLPIPSRSL